MGSGGLVMENDYAKVAVAIKSNQKWWTTIYYNEVIITFAILIGVVQ